MFKSQRTIFSPVTFYCLFLTNQLIIAEDAENKVNPLLEKFNVTAIKQGRAQVPAEEILEIIKNLSLPASNEIGARMQTPVDTSQNVQDLIIQLRGSNPTKKKFWIGQEVVTWVTALSKCSEKNMRLASIKSPEDQLGMVQELFRIGGPIWSLWAGGTELFEEGSWMWVGNHCGGYKFDSYTLWMKNEPEPKKHCIRVMSDGWVTSPCDDRHWFICEEL